MKGADRIFRYYLYYAGASPEGVFSIGVSGSDDLKVWSKCEHNPVLTCGGKREWDMGKVEFPKVMFNNDNGKYYMYYGGIPSVSSHYWAGLGLAIGENPTNFEKHHSNSVMARGKMGKWDSLCIVHPVVLKEGKSWKMWYAGSRDSAKFQTGYATSPDGIHWTKHEKNPILSPTREWEKNQTVVTDVVRIDCGYIMVYVGNTAGGTGHNWQIGYATSSDGTNWTKYAKNPIIDLRPFNSEADDPTILCINKKYYLVHAVFFEGGGAELVLVESRDMKRFTRIRTIHSTRTCNNWDARRIKDPNLIRGESYEAC